MYVFLGGGLNSEFIFISYLLRVCNECGKGNIGRYENIRILGNIGRYEKKDRKWTKNRFYGLHYQISLLITDVMISTKRLLIN